MIFQLQFWSVLKAAYDCVTYETSPRNATTQITAAWETKASLKQICSELARGSNVTRRRIDSKDEWAFSAKHKIWSCSLVLRLRVAAARANVEESDIFFIVSFALSIFLPRYGHGYELFSVASSPDGSLLASACKVCISSVAWNALELVHLQGVGKENNLPYRVFGLGFRCNGLSCSC